MSFFITFERAKNDLVTKRILPILILCMLLFSYVAGYGQGLSVTVSSTPSICYNDGTLTVTASGGTGPYTYKITAGPSNPNITYPIILPSGNNVFINLPHGSFTVVVTDAAGHTGTFTETVGGTYQFPSLMLDTGIIHGIVAIVSGGRPPYQYAISTTSANAGFGTYQSSPDFADLCPGQYWVRVRDSCQNIFTNNIGYTYGLTDSLTCVNYSKGFFSVHAYHGHPPYTYSIGSFTNQTGVFSGLPAYFTGTLVITDSCGVQIAQSLGPGLIDLFEVCPFDSTIHVAGVTPSYPDTLTFICTDCTPVQTVRSTQLISTVVFHNIVEFQNYHIVVLSSACGGDTMKSMLNFPTTTLFAIGNSVLSCNSFMVTSTATFDSVILRNSLGVIVAINHDGIFFHMPTGTYTATAYTHSSGIACYSGDSANTTVTVPAFPPYCEALTRDSSCHSQWELIISGNAGFVDKFSLIYRPGDTVAGSRNGNYQTYFYGLGQGTYTLISDSGCTEQVTLDTIPTFSSTAVSYLPCVGPPTIELTFNGQSGNICQTFYSFTLTLNDTLVNYTPSGAGIEVTDSGWYQIIWYVTSFDASGNLFYYDQTCPLDSNLLYVSNSHVPTPLSNSAYICGVNPSDSVHFQIYGGFIPYTVEIPGFDTLILQTNTGTFPTSVPGQYSMIVYDNCGISRSITFSIIDTCSGCPTGAIVLPDTVFCLGDPVPLRSTTTHVDVYQWLINDTFVARTADTTYIPPAVGHYQILLMIYSISGCVDSLLAGFDVVGPYPAISLGPDTSYCDTFSRVLSTGITATVWSTGQTGAQITVDTPGRYWATVSNQCGIQSDTIDLFYNAVEGLSLTADQTTLCSDRPDSVVLHASVDSVSLPQVTFVWSGGQIDSPAYSASLTAHTAGSYQVTAREGQCLLFQNIILTAMKCDSTDTTVVIDTTCIHKMAVPNIFSPNGDSKNDTFMVLHTCPVSTFSIHIYNRWGQLVFESTNIDRGWDGTYRGRPEPEEVCTWFVCARDTAASINICSSGTLTLVR